MNVESMSKGELWYTVAGNERWSAPVEDSTMVSQKSKHKISM